MEININAIKERRLPLEKLSFRFIEPKFGWGVILFCVLLLIAFLFINNC